MFAARLRWVSLFALFVAAAGFSGWGATPAWAQKNYKILTPKEEPSKQDRINAMKCCSDGTLANKAAIDRYVESLLGSFTDPKQFAVAAEKRKELKYFFLQRAGRAEDKSVSKYLNAMMVERLPQLMSTEYHPFARVNAAIVLGDLNDIEAPSSGKEPPVPNEAALQALLKEYQDQNQVDGVRASIMLGIDRHCRFGIRDADLKKKTIKLLSETAQLPDSDEGKTWLRRRAIKALGHLGFAGENGEIAGLVLKVMANEQEPLLIRCEAAYALGFLKLKGTPNLKQSPIQIAHLIALLAVKAADETGPANWLFEELHQLQEYLGYLETGLTGPDPTMYRRGVDGDFGDDRGLLKGGFPNEQKAQFDALYVQVDDLLKVIFSRDFADDRTIVGKVEQLAKFLEENPVAPAAGGGPAAAPAPQPAPPVAQPPAAAPAPKK